MPILGWLDIHRKQITSDYLDTVTGLVLRGQIAPADSSLATSRAMAEISVPDADAMMIVARRTRTDRACASLRSAAAADRPYRFSHHVSSHSIPSLQHRVWKQSL